MTRHEDWDKVERGIDDAADAARAATFPGGIPLRSMTEHMAESRRLAVDKVTVEALVPGADVKPTVNAKDREATTRLPLSLVPPGLRSWCALAMAEGDLKYGGFNFRATGVQASIYFDAMGRHMDKWFFHGEEVDPKTLVPHLGNAAACLAIIIDGIEQGNIIDDRPPRQPTTFYEGAEKIVAHLQSIFPRRVQRYREKP